MSTTIPYTITPDPNIAAWGRWINEMWPQGPPDDFATAHALCAWDVVTPIFPHKQTIIQAQWDDDNLPLFFVFEWHIGHHEIFEDFADALNFTLSEPAAY